MVGPSEIVYGKELVSQYGAYQLLHQYRRICGWFRVATRLPAVAKVITKTQSARGVNSPYTTLALRQLWGKYPSPHELERKLWLVRRRAEAIFTAYEGYENPSWVSVALGLLAQPRSVGKAAIMAVAGTISGNIFNRYREAREWLIDFHLCKVEDISDGVEARREAEPRLHKLGVAVYRIAMPVRSKNGRQVGVRFEWLVRSESGRTYHHEYGGADDAFCAAVTAWKKQDTINREEADLVGFLRGKEGYCPLIVRQYSYAAGNCRAGTESWLRRNGWGGRTFIPGHWLIPHLEDERVRRVVVAARGVLPLAA